MVEIDVRATRDGHLIVFHDRRVDGTTGGTGYVAELSLEEIRRLRTADGQPIPTLDEALAFINQRVGLILDLKSQGIAERAWASVKGANFTGPAIYASFLHAELLTVRRLASGAHTMALFEGAPVRPTAVARDAKASHVGLGIDSLTGGCVEALQAEGLRVFVYTVNNPADITWVESLGVDGIISDFPERL